MSGSEQLSEKIETLEQQLSEKTNKLETQFSNKIGIAMNLVRLNNA